MNGDEYSGFVVTQCASIFFYEPWLNLAKKAAHCTGGRYTAVVDHHWNSYFLPFQLFLLCLIPFTVGEQVYQENLVQLITPEPPPVPYAFGYAAGRFPGHIDRTHSEVSDGSGIVQGI